eukprot:5076053-Amphidinium_carterae.1
MVVNSLYAAHADTLILPLEGDGEVVAVRCFQAFLVALISAGHALHAKEPVIVLISTLCVILDEVILLSTYTNAHANSSPSLHGLSLIHI